MRIVFSLVLSALVAVGVVVAAQGHDNSREAKAGDGITLAADLRVGRTTLPAGDYRVVCDRTEVIFTRTASGKSFKFPCNGKELDRKAQETRTLTKVDGQGVRYLAYLHLKGSIVEHVFE